LGGGDGLLWLGGGCVERKRIQTNIEEECEGDRKREGYRE